MSDPLLQGFERFRKDAYKGPSSLMQQLVEKGQSPDYFIISCIDSRSNPGTIFHAAPGTFFGHKAMGAIVRPYEKGTALAAALQFALNYNKVREIIVLGHTGCGAIRALVEEMADEEISSFVAVAKTGLDRARERCAGVCTHESLLRLAEEEIVLQGAENLKTYPSVKKAIAEERAIIKPWLFDMKTGDLLEYRIDAARFVSLTQKPESDSHKNNNRTEEHHA